MGVRLRVLLSAYACEPHKGSEPLAGWCWSEYLAKICDVAVITRTNNRPLIERALAEMSGPKPTFIFYDPPAWIVELKKWGLPLPLYYIIWQIGAFRKVSHHLAHYDVLHHVTFNSFLVPGFWWRSHPAVVLGPLGGGMTTPTEFLPVFSRSCWREICRTWCVRIGSFNPMLLRSLRFARAVIAANADTKHLLSRIYTGELSSMVDVGIRATQVRPTLSTRTSRAFRILWVGSLEPRKAPIFALQAFALCSTHLGHASLDFIGDGPQRKMLETVADTLGLAERIRFRGRLEHDDAVAAFHEADAFLFTSVRDTSGNVLLEAMAAGLPSVVLCHQGAAEITTPETAIRVAPNRPEVVIDGLAEGISTLAGDASLRAKMGQAARQRVLEHFTWEKKAEAMMEIYHRALDQTAA
jgi:glycosyltransferase involved in cell wall biosynthesis